MISGVLRDLGSTSDDQGLPSSRGPEFRGLVNPGPGGGQQGNIGHTVWTSILAQNAWVPPSVFWEQLV